MHIVIFENFVKSMTSCLSKLKVTPRFCFAFKIHDNVTATNACTEMKVIIYYNKSENIRQALATDAGCTKIVAAFYFCKIKADTGLEMSENYSMKILSNAQKMDWIISF